VVTCGGRDVRGIARTYADRTMGQITALVGSNGMLEIAVVNGSARQTLNVAAGAEVQVRAVGET
jgi:S-adenosylmethionine hydrolase